MEFLCSFGRLLRLIRRSIVLTWLGRSLKTRAMTLFAPIFGLIAHSSNSVLGLVSAMSLVALVAACTLKNPGTETPAPNEQGQNQGIEKSFFFEERVEKVKTEVKAAEFKDGNKIKDAEIKTEEKTVRVPRTFLCNWAPETEIGELGEELIASNMPVVEHCNLIFEITEKALLGKRINPSFPNDPKRWATIVHIPITAHYYYERKKDELGRDTNEWIENTSRSDWSARPLMKIDLAAMTVLETWSEMIGSYLGTHEYTLNIENIEWDKTNHFLGFTMAAGSGTNRWGEGGSQLQGRFRVNFKAFKHNPNFKKTPYHMRNSEYFNALHIVGEKTEDLQQIMNAAHWDLSKPILFHLSGFPDRYRPLAVKVVNEWNEALRAVGVLAKDQVGFKVVDQPIKYSFDLRYNSITWIADYRRSAGKPLGIGWASADVRNGEILWAGITLWGGFIEKYIKIHMDPTSGLTASRLAKSIFDPSLGPTSLMTPPFLQSFSAASREAINSRLLEKYTNAVNENMTLLQNERLKEEEKRVSALPPKERELALKRLQEESKSLPKLNSKMVEEIVGSLDTHLKEINGNTASFFAKNNFHSRLVEKVLKEKSPEDQKETTEERKTKELGKPADHEALRRAIGRGAIFDLDRNILTVGAGWAKQIAESKKDNFDEIMDSVIKDLMSHEFGHVIGLGHQFKENILPEEGTVPERIYQDLKKKSLPENGGLNMTSVMGYRSPRTEILTPADEIKPGEHDKLVLAYLYGRKYATYKKGDENFQFAPVPESGLIPRVDPQDSGRKTSYFPQCNDIDASLSIDPFCNRHDRGTTAKEIVDSYFQSLTDNIHQDFFAHTDSRASNAEMLESRLWWRSLSTFGRLRVFYDYMRREYKEEIDTIRGDEEALYEFRSACKQDSPTNPKLAAIFSKKPGLKELCVVNGHILEKIADVLSLNLVDFTVKDHKNRLSFGGIMGGDIQRDWGRFAGTWKELSGLPLKVSALYALTSPTPWWMTYYGPYPIYGYEDSNQKYWYGSLYPYEYTKAVAATVDNNLSFASLKKDERTRIGETVFTLGWFNFMAEQHNDHGLFPKNYMDRIYDQHRFSTSVAAIIITPKKKEGGEPHRFDRLDGQVWDLQTGKFGGLRDVYILPNGEVLAQGADMFLYSFTKLRFLSEDVAYTLAYKLDYTRQTNDKLSDSSVKMRLKDKHDLIMRACIYGPGDEENGLAYFFKGASDFRGFHIQPKIGGDQIKIDDFDRSVDEAFKAYQTSQNFKTPPSLDTCRETLRGLAVIISSSAIVNGYFLPEARFYLSH